MNVIFTRNYGATISLPRIFSKRLLTTSVKEESKSDDLDLQLLDEQPVLQDKEVGLSEEEIEQKRNKSRLRVGDRNILNGIHPQNEVIHRFQETVKYKRRMFGRYGIEASDFPIGIAWPTRNGVKNINEYESFAYPDTIQEALEKVTAKKIAQAESIRLRDETVAQNLAKLDQWTADLNARVAKKEAEAMAARQRKNRLIDEVRRHFGYNISVKDERFKALLYQKEQAEKKIRKAAKKEARQQKLISLLEKKSAKKPVQSQETDNDSKTSDNLQ